MIIQITKNNYILISEVVQLTTSGPHIHEGREYLEYCIYLKNGKCVVVDYIQQAQGYAMDCLTFVSIWTKAYGSMYLINGKRVEVEDLNDVK